MTRPPQPGEVWRCTTRLHHGHRVRVAGVAAQSVYYRLARAQGRSTTRPHRLPLAAFQAMYVPYSRLGKERT